MRRGAMFRASVIVGLLVCGSVIYSPAHGGSNGMCTARLSWSDISVVTDLPTLVNSPTPLYVLLENTPDVRELAIELQWRPNSIVGPCYYLQTGRIGTSQCGWNDGYLNPPAAFDGDSTYSWRIAFE